MSEAASTIRDRVVVSPPGKAQDREVEIILERFEVVNAQSYASTEVSGGGGGGSIYSAGRGYTSGWIAPISISSRTKHHQNLLLRAESQREHTLRLDDSPLEFRKGGQVTLVHLRVGNWQSDPFYALYSVEQDAAIWREDQRMLAIRKAGLGSGHRFPVTYASISILMRGLMGFGAAVAVAAGIHQGMEAGWLPESIWWRNGGDGEVRTVWFLMIVLLPMGLILAGRLKGIRRARQAAKIQEMLNRRLGQL